MPKNNRHGQAKILSDSELSKIRKQFKSPRHRILFDILRYTGERLGAVVQLRVEDVYRDAVQSQPHTHITFRARTRKADTAGNRQTRQVPIHPNLKESLQSWRPPLTGWLFAARFSADNHITFHGAAWALGKAVAEAGMEGQGISSHSFRRSAITKLHESGADIRLIQEVTGHKDLRSLQRYVEVKPERVQQAINLL